MTGTTAQRYVSEELTHCVGASLSTREYQYARLLKIVGDGYLTPRLQEREKGIKFTSLGFNPDARLSKNEMYRPDMVCFCDIPVNELGIHVAKYSRFALAFSKQFVAAQGGAPVHYLPVQTTAVERTPELLERQLAEKGEANERLDLRVPEQKAELEDLWARHRDERTPLGDLFDSHGRRTDPFFDAVYWHFHEQNRPLWPPNEEWLGLRNQARDLRTFLDIWFFSYLKFFDATLAEDDPENFYMEREWRIIGDLDFDLDDVVRVIVPKDYRRRLHEDLPDYSGQVTFL
jgi:hypothetical protein